MLDMKTIDQRLANLERVLPSLSLLNLNVFAVLGRVVKDLSPEAGNELRKELEQLKSHKLEGVEVELIHNHIEAIIQIIFGSAQSH